MKSLQQVANESLNTYELELAAKNNEIFYTAKVIESLVEKSSR
jgi:hypothetical protein